MAGQILIPFVPVRHPGLIETRGADLATPCPATVAAGVVATSAPAKEAIPYGRDPPDTTANTTATGGVVSTASSGRRMASALQTAREVPTLDMPTGTGGAAVAQGKGLLPRRFASLGVVAEAATRSPGRVLVVVDGCDEIVVGVAHGPKTARKAAEGGVGRRVGGPSAPERVRPRRVRPLSVRVMDGARHEGAGGVIPEARRRARRAPVAAPRRALPVLGATSEDDTAAAAGVQVPPFRAVGVVTEGVARPRSLAAPSLAVADGEDVTVLLAAALQEPRPKVGVVVPVTAPPIRRVKVARAAQAVGRPRGGVPQGPVGTRGGFQAPVVTAGRTAAGMKAVGFVVGVGPA